VSRSLQVEACSPELLVQDLGRPGHAHLGVGRSGACDRGALRLANRLVGNPEGLAGLELLLGGAVLRASGHLVVAVAGAVAPVSVDGRPAGRGAPLHLRPGARLDVGVVTSGLRVVVAVRGGVAVAPVLGSRSRDTLAGLGPAPLGRGDRVPVGPAPGAPPLVDVAPAPEPTREAVLRLRPGPRLDWFRPAAWEALTGSPWAVSPASSRVGVRLEGPPLTRVSEAAGRELPSEGMVRGALQVPPDGRPLVLGPDHPTTGGYPVVAVVVDADLDELAQCPPGASVRFRSTG
jgi:biotin-dependent carboxylase-like uncharacterized protein